jgi:hypothetical protein
MRIHQLMVLPCQPLRPDDHNWPGRFDAHYGDRLLVERSRTPFCDGARALLDKGLADPGDRLVMRYAGSESDALISTVGTAAKLTVSDANGPPQFRPWKPFQTMAGSPPVRESVGEAVQ